MIPVAEAFRVALGAIAGTAYHDAPCDITIERTDRRYTVAFASPARPGTAAAAGPRVVVDAESGAVVEVGDAAAPPARLPGFIAGRRAMEIGDGTIRDMNIPHDEHWTTTVVLQGDRYDVTFPLPAARRVATRRADYALQVRIDARTGEVTDIRHAS